MTAETLKKLIADIPDDEEVVFSYYDNREDEHNWYAPAHLEPYFVARVNRSISDERVWVFSENNARKTLVGLISAEEKAKKETRAALKNSFPTRKNWSIKSNWSETNFEIEFETGGYKQLFVVMSGRKKKLQARFGSDDLVEFDTWEEFFEMAVPVVKRRAQKQRESLESLLDNEI